MVEVSSPNKLILYIFLPEFFTVSDVILMLQISHNIMLRMAVKLQSLPLGIKILILTSSVRKFNAINCCFRWNPASIIFKASAVSLCKFLINVLQPSTPPHYTAKSWLILQVLFWISNNWICTPDANIGRRIEIHIFSRHLILIYPNIFRHYKHSLDQMSNLCSRCRSQCRSQCLLKYLNGALNALVPYFSP